MNVLIYISRKSISISPVVVYIGLFSNGLYWTFSSWSILDYSPMGVPLGSSVL
ncbi:hypothetical protein TMEN_7147 [Trichophyton mentagrophytes]|nr:hypothetical protein TMEN_7147 [Trichophyton mentagrophytes]